MEFWRFIGSNGNIGFPLTFEYNPVLVFLSLVVASLAAYAALSVVPRIHPAKKFFVKMSWLAAGAMAMGTGIWSMHFIAMLSFSLLPPGLL